jgi:hypothetical protein
MYCKVRKVFELWRTAPLKCATAMTTRLLSSLIHPRQRPHFVYLRSHYTLTSPQTKAVDDWLERAVRSGTITKPEGVGEVEPVSGSHLKWLATGLPTRQLSRGWEPSPLPFDTHSLPLGYHLAFPEVYSAHSNIDELGLDGTSPRDFFDVPEPFVRRMWAGGTLKFIWSELGAGPLNPQLENGYRVDVKVTSAEKKSFDEGDPKVFFKRQFGWHSLFSYEPEIVEERVHVFLTPGHVRKVREGSSNVSH